MASRFWVGGTGTWDASTTTHWAATSGGAGGASVPTTTDNVFIDGNSGTGTITLGVTPDINSIDFTGYTGTFSTAAGAFSVTVNQDVTLASGMTITSNNLTLNWHTLGSATAKLTSAGKTIANINIGGSGATVVLTLQDANIVSGGTVTLNGGTLNTNGQTCTWAAFNSSNSNTRTLTLGASSITLTGGGTSWTTGIATNITITTNTATITLSGAAAVLSAGGTNYHGTSLVFSGSGAAGLTNGGGNGFANLTRTGTAAKTDTFAINTQSTTLSGTFTVGGNTIQGVNRMLVQTDAVGTQRTVTAAAHVITGDVDFMDVNLAYSGAASWTNTGSAYIGDALGNSGAVTTNVTASATQTWQGTSGGNWSTAAKWTSRVPLPQDDVSVASAFSAAQTVTADMPRLGRSITFAGSTGNPTFTPNQNWSIYGSLTYIAGMTLAGNVPMTFAGRGVYTLTSAGLAFRHVLILQVPGGSLTLQDNFTNASLGNNIQINDGTFDANGKTVTTSQVTSNSGRTRTINMGGGTWTIAASSGTAWSITTNVGLTLNHGGSTIALTDTGALVKTFAGNGNSYGTLKHTSTGAGGLTITGSNTFVTLDLECTTARTITFPASGTQTITGTLTLQGASGQLLACVSSTPGTIYNLTVGGTGLASFANITDCSANGGASIWATNSTNGGNNHNVIFAQPTRLALGGVG